MISLSVAEVIIFVVAGYNVINSVGYVRMFKNRKDFQIRFIMD